MENAAPADGAGLAAAAGPGVAAERESSEGPEGLKGPEGPEGLKGPESLKGPAGPVWRFLIKPRWLGWHLLMVVSFWGMLWLGDWQFHRAMSGNALSWAYTFEWPLFAGFAVVFWAKTIRDEFRIRRGESLTGSADEAESLPFSVRTIQVSAAQSAPPAEDEDEELTAYNAYRARLNAEVKNHGRWHGLR